LSITAKGEKLLINNGKFLLLITRDNPFLKIEGIDGQTIVNGISLSLKSLRKGEAITLIPLPAEIMEKEEIGPLHSVVRLRGRFTGIKGENSPFLYDLRIHAFFKSERLRFSLTVTNFSPREGEPALISRADFQFMLNGEVSQTTFGGDGKRIEENFQEEAKLLQENAYSYQLYVDGSKKRKGQRADGWLYLDLGKRRLYLGVRYFWQNHPISLISGKRQMGLCVFKEEEPFEWEGGLGKTFDFYLTVWENKGEINPFDSLVGIAPPSWIAGTKVLGDILPKGKETMKLFPYWEAILESSARKWARGMATGIRDFGDSYYGGPYKGKNSYANLEYDVPFDFLVQFVRTGERWYLDVAEAQVRHQTDIDIDHFTGRQWKHSPLHTTTEADLGHIFLRGLLLHYLLRGEKRSLEVAEEIGRWLTPKVERLEGMTNERQIGWSLLALTELYKVTRREDYLRAAEKSAIKLAREQFPTGRFNIRWDNRISFMNGIAMKGLLNVYLLTGKEEIYQAVLKLAYRTFGFYPEYACRTLDALSFLAERTKDARFLNLISRTWESSMEFLLARDALPAATFSWEFLHFAGKHKSPLLLEGNFSLEEEGWRFLRLNSEQLEINLQGKGNVLAVLEGLGEGEVILYDAKGRVAEKVKLKDEKLFKGVNFQLGGGKWRLILRGSKRAIWELHYDKGILPIIYDPSFSQLPAIYPKANCVLKEGAREIRILLRAKGEGFHKALVYDPSGHLVSAVEKFIDLGDTNSYVMEIKVVLEKGGKREGWGIEIYDCEVLEVDGLKPFLFPAEAFST
ncbi:MAG: hypothetical protein ACPL7E_03330, partial [bacterium]